jgi:hypothetical protein
MSVNSNARQSFMPSSNSRARIRRRKYNPLVVDVA